MASHKSDINVGIKFNADTQQARQQLQQLQNQLDSLISSTAKNTQMPLNKNLKEALNAAAQLKVALQAATNIDTGNLDLSKFSAQLKQSGIQLKDYAQHFINLGPEGEKAFMDLTKSIVTAEVPLKRSVKLFDEMWTTMKNTARWEISSRVLHGFESALSNAYRYAQDLNKSLTDIRIVTGYGADRMADFAIEANKAAKALSTTTNEYTKASLIYFQQGLSDQEVQQRSDITVKMSNVTRDSAQEVSDQMTAIWNNFADGSHTLEYYADVMTALGAATASSTAEISQGLEKFAAVAETVGLSYEYAASALATITSNTRQSADVVGTALKTLFARIQGLSLGETLDDGTTLTKYSEALAKVGIDIKEQNGELKAMDNILNEMANKWDTLNNDQQVALAQTVAGVRQYTQLIALMENWDNGDEDSMMANLRTSSGSEGALQEQQDIYAESWEAARDRVTVAWESIYNKILDSDFFIKLTNLFADATNGLDKFIDMAGGLPGILSLIASLVTKIFGPQIAKSLQTLAYNFEVFTGSAEAKANTLRKQAKDAIDDFNKNLDKNSADYLEGEVRKRDIDRSFELQQMKNISDETREYYQTLIDIERQYGENAVAARRATEMASQQIESTETNFKHKIRDANLDPDKVFSGSTTNAVQYNGKTIATTTTPNIQEKFLSFQDIYSGVSQIKTDGRKGSSIDSQLKKVKDLQKLYPELEDARKRFAEAEEKYQKRDKTNAEEGKKLNQERAAARAAMVEQVKKAQTQQLSETKAVINAIQAFKKLHPEVDITTEEFSNYADELQNLINKENQKREAEKNNKDAQENLNNQFKKGVPALTSYTSSIVNMANGISSVIFGLTSMKSAFEALNNTDMSFSEKLGSFFTSFSMSIGSLISGLGGLGQGIKTLSELNIKNFIPSLIGTIAGLDVETQVTGKNTKEKLISILVAKGWITAEQAATMTAWGLTKALWAQVAAWMAAHAAILLIVAAIGILVAAFVAVQQNTPEKKLEKLSKEAEESKKAADEAKQSYEELKTTIENYDSAIESLEGLTKGTKEFEDAVKSANEQAKKLIETYGISQGVKINSETGLIEIDQDSIEEAIELADNQAESLNITAYLDNEKVKEQQLTIDQSKQAEKLFSEINDQSFSTETTEAIGKNLDAILTASKNAMLNGSYLVDIIGGIYAEGTPYAEWADDFAKKLNTSMQTNSGNISLIWEAVKENSSALKVNTEAILFGDTNLSDEEFYQNSNYKNTLSLEYASFVEDNINSNKKIAKDLNKNELEDKLNYTWGWDSETQSNGYWFNGQFLGNLTEKELEERYANQLTHDQAVEYTEDLSKNLNNNSKAGNFVEAYNLNDYSLLGQSLDLNILNYYKNLSKATPRDILAQVFGDANILENLENYGLNEEDINKYINFINLAFEDAIEKLGINKIKDPNLRQDILDFYDSLSSEEKTLFLEIDLENKSLDEVKQELDELTKERSIKIKVDNSFSEGMTSTMEAIQTADEVLGNYKENGKISFSDVSNLAEDFGDVEDYQLYIDMMTAEGATAKDVERALEGLVSKKIDLLAANEDLSEKDIDLIDLMLEEAGVVNHQEVAYKKVGKALSKNYSSKKEYTDQEKKALAIYWKSIGLVKSEETAFKELEAKTNLLKEEFKNATDENGKLADSAIETAIQIIGEGDASYQARLEIFKLVIQENILNNTDLDLSQQINQLSQLAVAAGLAASAVAGASNSDYRRTIQGLIQTGQAATELEAMLIIAGVQTASGVSEETEIEEDSGVDLNGPEDKDSGGGSESSAEPLEYEDEIERYHENTRQLERLTRALEKVSKAKDRAFGKERLRLIDEEIAATERLVGQQRALLHETREYLKQDFAEIQQYGFTTDQYGELTNYDEVMKQQIDKYNAAVATGNQDTIDAAKKEYEEFKENMEQYEETLTQYEEAQAQLQEYINQVVDLKLEKITTEVEIKILVNDKELTRLEYLLRKIEYEGKGAADAIGLMGKQFEQINEKAKPIQEAIDKIYEQARAEGRGLLEEEVKEIKSFYEDGTISSEEEKRIQEIYDKAASEDRMLTQAEEEQIQEYKEQLLELNEEVMDIVETIEGKFIETLEELNGKVDESIGRFATYTGMFQTLSDVITLSGKAGSKYGMDMLNTLSARTVANASTAMRSNLRSYEALNQIYEEEQANLERAIRTGDERLIKQYQDRLHEVEMMRETSYESMLSSWSEALQAANDLFDTKLTNMITSLKQNLGDIDKLVEIYDRAVELEDLYISGNKSIYELSKLARDVGKDIDKTANIIAKNKLTNLLEQINKLRAEGIKLSQYDLEYWQAKYELELAEIALQEAQEAKAQVKLTRNTAGGWGYTYVADAEAISEAQQNYEDSLYNMQELHDEYIRDYSERLIKNRQELVNALQDLDKTSLTFEEDALKLKEHHFKQEEYLIDELNKAYQRAGVSYQDTLLAQTYGGASLEDSHTNFINSVVKMIQDELLPGYQEFQESVDDINSQAGTTVEDAMDKIFESSMTMEDEVIKNINDLTSGVKEVSDEIWNFQETYGEAIAKMLQDNEDYYSKTIKMYQNFMDETEADKWLQYYDDMQGPGEVLGLAGSGATGAMAGNGSTAITNSTFSTLNGWLGSLNSATGRSGSSKSNGSKNSVVLGEGAPEGMLLNSDGTNRGITVISPDEENISYAQIRAARDLKGSGNGNLSGYDTNGDGALNKSELSKALKAEGINPKDEKYNKDSDKEKDPTLNGTLLATGGYTGSWGPDARWALLHEKELVLNKYDTENMLNMVNTLRDIDWRAKIAELWPAIEEKFIMPALNQAEELLQEVHIEASFPGISDRNELEEAFHNLINTASQYANRKRY